MSKRIEFEFVQAFGAFAVEIVRLRYAIAVQQEHLNKFGSIVLSSKHDGRDVR
jgi:hypothetical protein